MTRRDVLVWAGWVVSRLIVVVLFVAAPHLGSDVNYWSDSLEEGRGAAATLSEYPVPAYVLLWIPWKLTVLAGGTPAVVFFLLSLGLDAGFQALLMSHRPSGRLARAGEVTWIAAGPALGAVAAVHFDIVTGVLVGAALVLGARSPGRAAVLATLAAGIKYWPAIVLPGMVLGSPSRRWTTAAVVVSGSVLAVVSAWVAGVGRLFSPLTWQGERGLQMEAVAATPAVVGHLVSRDRFPIVFADHLSYEVRGPGVGASIAATTVVTVLLVALLAALWWRARRSLHGDALVWLTLTAVVGFVAVDKVFSPQYLLWLTPVAAGALVRSSVGERTRLAAWSAGLVLACLATQLGPVLGLDPIIRSGPGAALPVVLLAVRNCLVVVLFLAAAVRSWTLCGREEPDVLGQARQDVVQTTG
jgi:hypothetical protein